MRSRVLPFIDEHYKRFELIGYFPNLLFFGKF
jgi:hypothetical protein